MWNLRGLVPESFLRLRVLALALAATGAVACGPGGGNSDTFLIVFALSNSPADLGTLSFRVLYENGSFVGNGADVSCELVNDEDDETAVFSDDDRGTLQIGVNAAENPLEKANDIVECSFAASGQPTADDFTVTVLAAEDDSGAPVLAAEVDVVVRTTDPATPAALQSGSEP